MAMRQVQYTSFTTWSEINRLRLGSYLTDNEQKTLLFKSKSKENKHAPNVMYCIVLFNCV